MVGRVVVTRGRDFVVPPSGRARTGRARERVPNPGLLPWIPEDALPGAAASMQDLRSRVSDGGLYQRFEHRELEVEPEQVRRERGCIDIVDEQLVHLDQQAVDLDPSLIRNQHKTIALDLVACREQGPDASNEVTELRVNRVGFPLIAASHASFINGEKGASGQRVPE